jgi:hypothetical protein
MDPTKALGGAALVALLAAGTTEITAATADWLTNTGAPNALLLLALLTFPATWSKRLRERAGELLDRATGSTSSETAESDGSQENRTEPNSRPSAEGGKR